MGAWAEKTEEFKTLLRLRTEPLAFRRFENISGVKLPKSNHLAPCSQAFCRLFGHGVEKLLAA